MAMFNPTHPGELIRETIEGIREETGAKLTVEELAAGLGTTCKIFSAIINGKQRITPKMALKLSVSFANTSPRFWLQAQNNYDLFQASKTVDTKNIKVFWKPAVL